MAESESESVEMDEISDSSSFSLKFKGKNFLNFDIIQKIIDE